MGETTTIRERPILFAPELVAKIIGGSKRATRRPAKAIHELFAGCPTDPRDTVRVEAGVAIYCRADGRYGPYLVRFRGPFGKAGDRLWVRETVAPMKAPGIPCPIKEATYVCYRDGSQLFREKGTYHHWTRPVDPAAWPKATRWVPSIHMPRWASRLTLEITSVTIEHLLDITDAEIPAEGAESRETFLASWDGFYAKAGFPAASNPWTWVYTFKPVEEIAR